MSELQQIGPSLWLCEGPIVDFYGFPYPTRSVIARLADGGLWVWSPIALTPALRAEVAELGPVAHLVSPNKIHHLFLRDWRQAWPDAALWGPASTIRKRRDLDFRPALEDAPPSDWAEDLDQAWFRGSPFMDEIVFFHRPSRTAIFADLSENFSDAFLRAHWSPWKRRIAKLWKITVGHGYAPLEWRLSFVNRGKARQALAKVLAWEPEQVVMAHGEWRRQNGLAYIERAFGWLKPS